MFGRLCEAMGKADLAEDPKFADHKARGENAAELDGLIGDWTATLTKKEVAERLEEHGVVCGPIYSIKDIAEDPHFNARDMIRDVEDPTFGNLKVPGIVPKLSETPGEIAWLGPSEPGQHNGEVLAELGYSTEDLRDLAQKGVI